VVVTGEGGASVPLGSANLAVRAAAALAQATGRRGRAGRAASGVRIEIRKRIPVAAGLAGGSADAAAALVACNELWRAGASPRELRDRMDQAALAEVGSLNRIVRTEESGSIERIDTLESEDADCDPTLSAERQEAKERFRKAFARLSSQERQVAVMLYAQGATLREIGERLGVSESRVSQVHTQLRRRLYEQLSDELSLFTALG